MALRTAGPGRAHAPDDGPPGRAGDDVPGGSRRARGGRQVSVPVSPGAYPTAKEAKKRTGPYRRDTQSARAALLTELVAGLEFADVVRRAVLEVSPDMEAPDVFAAVARVVSVFPSTVYEGDGGEGFTLEGALNAEIQKTITEAQSDE